MGKAIRKIPTVTRAGIGNCDLFWSLMIVTSLLVRFRSRPQQAATEEYYDHIDYIIFIANFKQKSIQYE
jgi:hypothetical protein